MIHGRLREGLVMAALLLGMGVLLFIVGATGRFLAIAMVLLTIIASIVAGLHEYGLWRTVRGTLVVGVVVAASVWMTDTFGWGTGWIPIVGALLYFGRKGGGNGPDGQRGPDDRIPWEDWAGAGGLDADE